MTFLNALDALTPKIPFSFFADFWVWVTSEAWGSVSVGFLGCCQLSPFFGEGGPAGGLYRPPPPTANPSSVRPMALVWEVSASGAQSSVHGTGKLHPKRKSLGPYTASSEYSEA